MGKLKDVAGRVRRRAGDAGSADLRRRVAELEEEMQEARALNVRVAELTDLVTELLVPLAQRDEEKLQALLARYHAGV